MKKHLIIVESPSKIKTLNKFLNDKYTVEASVGHIRDLPKSKLGIDVENDFSAEYHVSPNSTKTVQTLKKALKNAEELLIATDPDREGEAIAWHIVDELKPKIPVKRLVFNEITKTAILDSFNNTREIDIDLVDAQETRRFLDRMFGFMVSEKLWFNMNGIRFTFRAKVRARADFRIVVRRGRDEEVGFQRNIFDTFFLKE